MNTGNQNQIYGFIKYERYSRNEWTFDLQNNVQGVRFSTDKWGKIAMYF